MISRISVLLFICLSGFLLFPLQSTASSTQADTLKVKWLNGRKFLLHKVQPRETWSHLARKYNCTINELMAANQGMELIKIDQIVNIPVVEEFTAVEKSKAVTPVTVKTTPPPAQVNIPVVHTVKSGETLFAIARKYDQSVENIKEINKLTADGIRPGQKLIVKYIGNSGNQVISKSETHQIIVPPPPPKTNSATAEVTTTPILTEEQAAAEVAKENAARDEVAESITNKFFDKPTKVVTTIKKGNNNKSMVQVIETGVATWILDGSTSGNKYFGLHRTAPIGTIVKVTNRMNSQSVYVKIVGVLPDTGENDNVIIKMSQAVSSKLNALDTFFQVELSYGMME